MNLQERRDKADIISKRAEIINKKVIALLAISGAIWLYGTKETGWVLLVTVVAFLVTSVALVTNIFKLGELEKN